MREDLFKLVAAVHDAHAKKPLDQSPESLRFLDKEYKGYIRNGLGLDAEKRARFMEIKKELSTLSIEFSKTLGEENGGIWFTPEELKGVPQDVLNTLKKGDGENEGKLWLTFKYPDYLPTMKNAVNPETRKKTFLGNENKCNENVARFQRAVELRDESARLLGFKSHAEFRLDTKMAKSPEKVLEFLNNLRTRLTPGGAKEKEVLVSLKAEELKELGKENDGKYYLWDQRYVSAFMGKSCVG